MIMFDFLGAVLAVAFWIVVIYAALRIAAKCIRTAREIEMGRDVLGRRPRR